MKLDMTKDVLFSALHVKHIKFLQKLENIPMAGEIACRGLT